MQEAGAPRSRLEVTTPVFEGPLELLLALAEREEIDILQVSLAALTSTYLQEVRELPRKDPVELADFLWLAARLLLLKSIRLLPGEPPAEEEADLLDWEEDVRRHLLEYRAYKEMARSLMAREAAGETSFPPPPREVAALGQEEPLRVEALLVAFHSVLARVPPRPLVYGGRVWTMEEKLDTLRDRLRNGPFDMVDVILECADRLEAVVTFVALLELLRTGAIKVRQKARFDQIWVERIE
jgi:segregation and condensation protein A